MTSPLLTEDLQPAPGLTQVVKGTDDWWASLADRAIRELARRGAPFQAFDLTELGVPEPDHPNRWGGALHRAARRGVIVACGAEPSKRPATAGSLVRTWIGVVS